MNMVTQALQERLALQSFYFDVRAQNPTVPAREVLNYVRHSEGESLQVFLCSHEWAYTGCAYGGDDESYHGEGRCYCVHCGADGDA